MKKIRVVSELMMVNVDLGLKIPAPIPLTAQEKILVAMVELDICPTPFTLPPK